ncbi:MULTISPECIES: biotin transporter BioY [Lysinibacillus]|uniref:Biotin transporter n=1 Tax=Lysinibacillus fusiformis TaxID=28031 RepID=A0A2I0UXY5_9BACI|nr:MULTISPECIES: biotin transporter BioY [Lysinibacillus]KUF35637.1 biotin synthase [Lysinibacillus sp. F5]MEE3809807.1 biotin transporter BioY [Lysinibacillus fusiformis]PKU50925.1 BioY family transporter [Lysinibacillus fusiformis]WCH49509.1 biotin transporter BioY [Lysinibacillus sp. OF-1]SCY14886.1 biotin transport system substrate-specific component [Lysinibacillus sp. SG9]
MKKGSTYQYVLAAFGAAIIAVLAQVTIPLPLIPITGQTLAVGIVVTILGTRLGTISVLLYILLGAVGLPVFSGMSGGLGILVGPTGGYIVGFLVTAIIMGLYLDQFGITFVHAIIANIIGMIITLAFGTVWLKIVAEYTWTAAFMGGVAPFIVVGIVKAVLAAWIGVIVRRRLESAHLIEATA